MVGFWVRAIAWGYQIVHATPPHTPPTPHSPLYFTIRGSHFTDDPFIVRLTRY